MVGLEGKKGAVGGGLLTTVRVVGRAEEADSPGVVSWRCP